MTARGADEPEAPPDAPTPMAEGWHDPATAWRDPLSAWQGDGTATRAPDPEGVVALVSDTWPRADAGLQITGGGAVAVDTDTLRTTATAFTTAASELEAIGLRLGSVQNMLLGTWGDADEVVAAASVLGTRLHETGAEAVGIAAALREAAAVYEVVEIDIALRAAALAGDADASARLEARRADVLSRYPEAGERAALAAFERSVMWPGELVRQGTQWGVGVGDTFSEPGAVWGGLAVGLGTIGGAALVGIGGTGLVRRDARLTGAAGPVVVTAVTPEGPPGVRAGVAPGAAATGGVGQAAPTSWRPPAAVAPQSLAAAASRIPGDGAARVRVEKYTMPDGSKQFALYIAGMQSADVACGDDPWDNESNLQLYSGRMSDSYAATQAALTAAGAEAGDAVHVVAFSQGGMIGAHLAVEGGYDVQTLVSLGSPVEADVGAGTLSVAIRHTDDPVAGLAGGGALGGVGAPGSFVAERVYDPATALEDAALPAHRLTAYAETAAIVDASGDPRVADVHAVFEGLAQAEAVEVSEYAAVRGDR
ncbi:hypothetical protein JNB62_03610 [Microbacterium jejuense]|uniref:Alpha/beta hydrolase n=1 Tax=Microbacterium jejuense TaxID=1263637 RepID=A0ABS7HJ58_9MICO|nr:hypothetical protein [Microbacterium jejuense]MBW9092765.1 hypothetical protein [Microbacterium jejuense]